MFVQPVPAAPGGGNSGVAWFRVAKMEMWNAFVVFEAVHRVEGGLIDAIRSKQVDASHGPDLDARLRRWSELYGAKILRAEAATLLLINTLSANLTRISDMAFREEISCLVGATMAAKKEIIPLSTGVGAGAGAMAQDLPLPRKSII
jgi:hypothetical protein